MFIDYRLRYFPPFFHWYIEDFLFFFPSFKCKRRISFRGTLRDTDRPSRFVNFPDEIFLRLLKGDVREIEMSEGCAERGWRMVGNNFLRRQNTIKQPVRERETDITCSIFRRRHVTRVALSMVARADPSVLFQTFGS